MKPGPKPKNVYDKQSKVVSIRLKPVEHWRFERICSRENVKPAILAREIVMGWVAIHEAQKRASEGQG